MEKNGLPKRKISIQSKSNMTKLIVLTEIYETDSISSVFKSEEGRFTKRERQFSLREILVNPEYIVSVREDTRFKRFLVDGLLPMGMNENQQFSKLQLAGSNSLTTCYITVVGDLSHIYEKTCGGRIVTSS